MTLPIQAEVKEAFLAFREHHDVEALALVFDRTAQGLLLVAGHLAGRSADAEDLVQATFVQAIRNAAAYDASRPLEPWLLGILTNEARNARRQGQRRVDGSRMPGEAAEDPRTRAEAREFAQQLQDAIEAMPERWREVTALYLVHGMTPTEIAHALAHPVGTVKSWIHRGLERLRGRLPAGMAVLDGSVLLQPDAVRWAATRDAVLAAARSACVAPPAAAAVAGLVTGTSAAMAPLRRLVLVALMAGAVALVLFVRSEPAASAVPVVAAHDRIAGQPTDPVASTPSPAAAPEVREAAVLASVAAELRIEARWADGEAAAVGGWIEPRHENDATLRRREFTTDAAGVAHVGDLLPGDFVVRLDRGGERLVVLQPGANRLDVAIGSGLEVGGRVLDDRGEPVAGAAVWLTTKPHRDDGAVVARSAADGTFSVRDVQEGSALAAFADGLVPTRCAQVRAGAGAARCEGLELYFERAAGVAELVVTAAGGEPVPGARVQLGATERDVGDPPVADDCRPPPPWIGRTDEHGRARCCQVPMNQRVPVFARAAGKAGAARWLRVGEAAASVVLQLPPSRRAEGTARLHGEPAAEAMVCMVLGAGPGLPTDAAPEWFAPSMLVPANGAWTLDGLPREHVLIDVRRGTWFAVGECLPGAADAPAWNAHLTRGGEVAGVVRCQDGASTAGYRIQLHASGIVHEQELAAGGRFLFEHLGRIAFEVVVREPAQLGERIVLCRTGIVVGDRLDLVVGLQDGPGATVRGQLLGADGSPLLAGAIDDARWGNATRVVRCDADGRFVADQLPPGDHVLQGGDYPYALVRRFVLRRGDDVDLGTMRAEAPALCLVSIAPQRAREGLEVSLVWLEAPACMVAVARWLGPHGTVAMPAPAGRYVLNVFDSGVLMHQQVVALAAGMETAVVLPEPVANRCVITLQSPEPASWTCIRWRVTGETIERSGSVSRHPGTPRPLRTAIALPAGRYRCVAENDRGERGSADFVVGDAGEVATAVLALR